MTSGTEREEASCSPELWSVPVLRVTPVILTTYLQAGRCPVSLTGETDTLQSPVKGARHLTAQRRSLAEKLGDVAPRAQNLRVESLVSHQSRRAGTRELWPGFV